MKQIIIRRAHFDKDGALLCFSYWGPTVQPKAFNGEKKLLAHDDLFIGIQDSKESHLFEGDIVTGPDGDDYYEICFISESFVLHSKKTGTLLPISPFYESLVFRFTRHTIPAKFIETIRPYSK